jgi:small redox-active disulfide protein 2
MKIEIFGTGCPKCKKTEENVKKAVKELGIKAQIEYVYDPMQMVQRGIVSTPAAAIDGEVLSVEGNKSIAKNQKRGR